MSARGSNLLVFRDGGRIVSGKELKSALFQQLGFWPLTGSSGPGPPGTENSGKRPSDTALKALLRAGELECAAVDAGSPPELFQTLTDLLAEALLNADFPSDQKLKELNASLEAVSLPDTLLVSTPEGFAYYGLHPLAFADVLEKLVPFPQAAAVIGVRSIGAVLSAVCCAATRQRGVQARRITVRPSGHPYDRRTEFSPEQLEFVRREMATGADFLVVDEGPGLSGSSLLSVGEALEQVGVPGNKITFICSHVPDAEALCAPDGSRRWRKFRSIAAAPGAQGRKPAGAEVWTGAGEWRRYLLLPGPVFPGPVLPGPVSPGRDLSGWDLSGPDSPQFVLRGPAWPASWTTFERPKYLSNSDVTGPRMVKFLGLGHYGAQVFDREAQVAAAGFAPPPRMESDGYVSYPLISGHPMRAEDLSEPVMARMAAYCAFRLQNFRAAPSAPASPDSLQQMAEHNLKELRYEVPVKLQMERPVLADARMQPYEWLRSPWGQVLKTDSGGHGDDHFFPGVTDIAWDLAGAIVEWKMEADQAAAFLAMYRRASGDDAGPRIPEFIKAYAVFRCAYCRMAANAMQGTEEQSRLEQAAANYGTVLERSQVEGIECRRLETQDLSYR